MKGATQQSGADTPRRLDVTTLKIRSLLTSLASLLATITTIIVALLPAMLAPAT